MRGNAHGYDCCLVNRLAPMLHCPKWHHLPDHELKQVHSNAMVRYIPSSIGLHCRPIHETAKLAPFERKTVRELDATYTLETKQPDYTNKIVLYRMYPQGLFRPYPSSRLKGKRSWLSPELIGRFLSPYTIWTLVHSHSPRPVFVKKQY